MVRTALLALAAAAAVVAACAASLPGGSAKLLVVTVTKGFRHDSIPTAERLLQRLADESGAFTVDYARTGADLASKTTPNGLELYAGVQHGRGRVFYTALGHREGVLEAGWFKVHLLGGIRWALGQL